MMQIGGCSGFMTMLKTWLDVNTFACLRLPQNSSDRWNEVDHEQDDCPIAYYSITYEQDDCPITYHPITYEKDDCPIAYYPITMSRMIAPQNAII